MKFVINEKIIKNIFKIKHYAQCQKFYLYDRCYFRGKAISYKIYNEYLFHGK